MAMALSSRGTIGWLSAFAASAMSAACFIVAFKYDNALLLPLAYLSALPFFAVGLGAGSAVGSFSAVVGSLIVAILAEDPVMLYTYVLSFALPSVVLLSLAMRYRQNASGAVFWYPEGNLLIAAVAYACIMFLIACGMYAGEENGLLGVSTQALDEIIKAMNEAASQTTDAATLESTKEGLDKLSQTLHFAAFYAPSALGIAWIFLIAISGVAAQITLRQQRWALRTPFKFTDLYAPNWIVLIAATAGLIGYFAPGPYNYIGANICVLACVPLFFVGLAVVHSYTATKKHPTILLLVFYTLLSVFFGFVLLVTLLGTLDQNLSFRQRFAKKLNQS